MVYLLNKYCISNNVIPFFGLPYPASKKTYNLTNYYNETDYLLFENEYNRLRNNFNKDEYCVWITTIANDLLEKQKFDHLPSQFVITNEKDVERILNTEKYFGNDCFEKRDDQKKNNKENQDDPKPKHRYASDILKKASYENIKSSFRSKSEKDVLKIKRVEGMLRICLSTEEKNIPSDHQYVVDFWKLAKETTAFRKMITLCCVEKLLKTLINPTEKENLFLFSMFALAKANILVDCNLILYLLKLAEKKYHDIIKEESIVFIDEFQNYSLMEINAIRNAFNNAHFNLFGDYDQQIDSKGSDLKNKIDTLLNPYSYNLKTNYRNAKQITDYINKSVGKNMISIGIDGSVEESSFAMCKYEIKDRTAIICKDANFVLTMIKGIFPNKYNLVSESQKIIDDRLNILSINECKGLEFETVYVFDYDLSENERYVAYTRALDNLIVIHDNMKEIKRVEEEKRKIELEKSRKQKSKVKAQEKSDGKLDESKENRNDFQEKHQESNKPAEENQKPSVPDVLPSSDQEMKDAIIQIAKEKIASKDLEKLKEALALLNIVHNDYAKFLIVQCNNSIEEIEKQKEIYKNNHLCQYCGGEFKGFFVKYCTNCGKKKDY